MRKFSNIILPVLASMAMVVVGCGEADIVDESEARPDGAGKDLAGKADQWNHSNDPERFQTELNYRLSELPTEGKSEHIPWPATYWPTYEDSTNVRWQGDGTLSPVQKYDNAFNGWEVPEGFLELEPYESSNCNDKSWSKEYYEQLGSAASYVSKNKGNAKARDGVDNDGDGETDECDDRDGVETWWGLCHAWVPAAMLEQEPQRAVEHNGVTFEVSDIKALLIGQYDRPKAYMLGGRCNDKEVERDEETGRVLNDECRDTNAGSYHVIMANFLGVMKRPVAEDRTYNYEVWNQPILEWKVNSMDEIDLAKAHELLKVEGDTYKYNDKAVTFFEVRSTSYYITESDASTQPFTDEISTYVRTDKYHYILELDEDGLIIGGEWLGSSIKSHPDFLWLPTGTRGGNPHVDLATIRMLLEKSRTPVTDSNEPDSDLLSYSNGNAFPVPDNNPTGATSTIDVPDDITVGKLEVDVDITHTYIGDLKVVLVKDGKEVVLHEQAGGSTDNLKRTFTTTKMTGIGAAGTWALVVSDHANADTGTLNSWTIKLAVAGGDTNTEGGTFTAESTNTVATDDNTTVSDTLNVSESKTVRGLSVTVAIKHSYIGALTVELVHGAVKHTLHNQEGGSGTEVTKTFDVTAFNGDNSSGDWELRITDNDGYSDTGSLDGWSMEFTY